MTQISSQGVAHPRHCRVSASPDKTQLALTFRDESDACLTLMLPIEGAVVLQRRLAQSVYLLKASRPLQPETSAAPMPA